MTKWWSWMVVIILLAIFVFGYQKMYFHQDDLDWLILANRPIAEVISAPIGDHVNYVWRALLKVEWGLFGFKFVPYLAVSILMHGCVIWLVYKLAKETSGREDLAAYGALLFSINTNWTESVLWISGQTITITALFVLLAMLSIWRKKGEGILMFLASWTSALAMGVLGASVLVFKKLRWKTLGVLVILGVIYKLWASDGTPIAVSLPWIIEVGLVWGLMLINSVVGRLIIPFDRLETPRIAIVGVLMVYGLWRMKGKLREIWGDNWSRFLLLQLGIYNLIVAVGRAQYGVGIMRAERYAYLGLALFLLFGVRLARNWKVGKWAMIVPILILVQIGGLWVRANYYFERPQQLKMLVSEMKSVGLEKYNQNDFLPHFVMNDERLKYGDLIELLKH